MNRVIRTDREVGALSAAQILLVSPKPDDFCRREKAQNRRYWFRTLLSLSHALSQIYNNGATNMCIRLLTRDLV